jgi:hypothetical protein
MWIYRQWRLSQGLLYTALPGRLFACATGYKILLEILVRGVAVAAVLLRLIRDILPAGLPGADTLHLDGLSLTLSTCAAGAAALVFGAWPAWAVTRKLQGVALGSRAYDSRRPGIASVVWRSRTLLVVLQSGFSAFFLTSAALLSVSLGKLLAVDPGFAQSRRIVLTIQPAGQFKI